MTSTTLHQDVALVLDLGSGSLKLGLSGYQTPAVISENMVGRCRFQDIFAISGKRDTYIGAEAQSKRAIMALSYPIKRGKVTNWNDLEQFLSYSFFHDLNESPHEHPLLLTEPPLANAAERKKFAQMFFETFDVLNFHTKSTSTLGLFASGRMTGIAVDCGDGLTWAVPMNNGYTFPHAILSSEFAGQDITNSLMSKLRISGTGEGFHSTGDREIVQKLKESLCFVNSETTKEKEFRRVDRAKKEDARKVLRGTLRSKLKPEIKRLTNEKRKLDDNEPDMKHILAKIEELEDRRKDIEKKIKACDEDILKYLNQKKKNRLNIQQQYQLPDGNKVLISKERYTSAELLFTPSKIGLEFPGIHELIFNAIQLCNIDVKSSLYQNIVLIGGTTLLPGIETRVKSEVQQKAPDNVKLNVIAQDNRRYASWLGGSVYSMMPTFYDIENGCITKEEYDEKGIFHRDAWDIKKFLFA
jgi:actin-related protein